jgi:DNA (cytosine-5)-methyltransferase 1
MILATFGPTYIESLAKFGPALYLPKTSLDISASVQNKCSPTFKHWVTKLRAACLQRRKSAQVTSEKGCSSLGWATPTVSVSKGGVPQNSKGKRDLRLDVLNWGTPTSRDWKDGACGNANVPVNGLLSRQAVRWKIHKSSRRARVTTGPQSPNTSGPRLNPVFVNWLMGWPRIVADGSNSLATEW